MKAWWSSGEKARYEYVQDQITRDRYATTILRMQMLMLKIGSSSLPPRPYPITFLQAIPGR